MHALYQGIEVIFSLNVDESVTLADRKDAVQPGKAKRNQVRHVLDLAAENFELLATAWEEMHR